MAALRRLQGDIGEMPPIPPTLRGRVGAVFVRVIQRSLFWLWPQLHAIFRSSHEILEQLAGRVSKIEDVLDPSDTGARSSRQLEEHLTQYRNFHQHVDEVQAELWLEIQRLRAQVQELRASAAAGHAVR